MSDADLFVVSAPSGAGKTTLIRRLLERVDGMEFSVSYTTRPPREGEREGGDYHFITDDRFDAMLREGGLLEWATVHGRRYGTGGRRVDEALARGRDVLLDVDSQGARSVRRLRPEAVLIFIMPPDCPALEARLRGRGGEPGEIARRIGAARAEMERHVDYDYVIVNRTLDEALRDLVGIVLARRRRRARMEPECLRILATFRSSDDAGTP